VLRSFGANTHNVSATISIDKDKKYETNVPEAWTDSSTSVLKDEWEVVGEWMWTNRDVYNGLSVLPYFGGTYQQAPFEDITEEEYNKRIATLHSVDLTNVTELDDTVDFGQVAACAGGACEVNL
jgi:ribonucleoside-diphosphate reductase alpha chain